MMWNRSRIASIKFPFKSLIYFLAIVGLSTVVGLLAIAVVHYPTSGTATPIVEEAFFFHEKGAIRELVFQPRLFKKYHVALVSSRPFPIRKKFNWSVRYEVFEKGKTIGQGRLVELTRAYAGNSLEFGSSISFASLEFKNPWWKKITLRLIVEETDDESNKFKNDFQTVVRIHRYH